MTTPVSPISLQSLRSEFGGSGPISLSQFYAGGSLVNNPPPTSSNQIGAIPTGGTISLGNFRGVTRAFIFNPVISSQYVGTYDLRQQAVNAGWDGAIPLFATLTVNAPLVAPSTGVYAFQSGYPYPAGCVLTVINNSVIAGMGGAGGAGDNLGDSPNIGTVGLAGGPAMYVNSYITVQNNGVIGGGGGGGGSGSSLIVAGDQDYAYFPGNGGGGGAGLGVGGAAGVGYGQYASSGAGNAGGGGSASAPGGGGPARTGTVSGNGVRSGAGGAGGTLGSSGTAGSAAATGGGQSSQPTSAGAGGACIVGNGNINWTAYGARYGSIS